MGSKHLFVKRKPLSHRLLKWSAPLWVFLAAWLFMTSETMDSLHTLIAPLEQPGTMTVTQNVETSQPTNAQTTAIVAPSTSETRQTGSADTELAKSNDSPDVPPISSQNSPTPETPSVTADLGQQVETDLRNAVEAWRKAWQTRDLVAYLDLYGPNFVPPQRASRQAWADTRRARIGSKQKIELGLKNLTLQIQGNTATVKFTQIYADDRVSMVNGKTMVWQQADGRWLIQSETTD